MTKKLFFLILLIATNSLAVQLTGAALLNKMSLSLTGKSASVFDQKEIAAIQDVEKQKEYLSNKIDQYMKMPEYTLKLTSRLQELFEFKLNPLPNLEGGAAIGLFNSLSQNNLSWDTLLTGKSYQISTIAGSSFLDRPNDFGFYGALIDLPNVANGYVRDVENLAASSELIPRQIEFANNDLRIAGAITTPHFFSRYATTGLNKNRRRAAAIFRIFLCDKMAAAIPSVEGIDEATYQLLYPKNGIDVKPDQTAGMSEAEVKAVLNRKDELHGTRADCRACHAKLDPLGKTLSTSSLNLGSMPSAGALAYKNTKGESINIPAQGISELAKSITQQSEYVTCQMRHFWNWYIGQDQRLTDEKMTALQKTFNDAGRKTNDFIKQLLLSSDFSERIIPDEIKDVALTTKNYLRRCQSCHDSAPDYFGVDLTKWPLGDQNDPKNNAEFWIKRIEKVLDLEHDGIKRTMPPSPKDGGFIPSRQDLELVKRWIQLGAPNEDAQRQVQP